MITLGDAVQRISQGEGRPVHLMRHGYFPEDTLVVMTDEVSAPEKAVGGKRLRQIRLTTFVGESPVSGIIVRTEWIPEEER